MRITSKDYNLNFIQTHPVNDNTDNLKSYIYTFRSPKTKLNYVLTAGLHENDFFAIKLDKRSNNRYSKVINKGDVGNILVTCAKVIPLLLKMFPNASFGFY